MRASFRTRATGSSRLKSGAELVPTPAWGPLTSICCSAGHIFGGRCAPNLRPAQQKCRSVRPHEATSPEGAISDTTHPIVRAELAEAETQLERDRDKLARLNPVRFFTVLPLLLVGGALLGLPTRLMLQVGGLAVIAFLSSYLWAKRSAEEQQLLVSQLRSEIDTAEHRRIEGS